MTVIREPTQLVKVRQAGPDLVVGFLDLFLGRCTRHTENLVEVLLAASRGAGVEGQRGGSMWRLNS